MQRHNFKKLKIWKEGMFLTRETYKMVRNFPDFEKFNLVSQLIRCAVSIPSNIAEGTSKRTDKHFTQYLENSLGSAFEWETQLIIAYSEEHISEEKFKAFELKIQEIQKMISGFIDGLEKS
ncbi:four helix bundle protein [Salegentibacter sp. JZCK2]|uniref:four helix bundle protein n=1 Tax=Salegentibacter tibetensis TaxID=2873600 RepID=UPI001CCE879B|nr:four helix bundle protein [Salegentibacter tibetensis]MBZ9729358.1 four helix bundle protein [Salegentibacter tibetensis]